MSVRYSRAVWESSAATGGARLVLLALADWADDRGESFPSRESIAAKCRMDQRHVRRAIVALLALGEIAVESNTGRGRTNTYVIKLASERGAQTPPFVAPERVANLSERVANLPLKGGAGATQNRHEPSRTVIARARTRTRAKATEIPEDFAISERVRKWAGAKSFDRLEAHRDAFVLKCRAKGYLYADHDAAFMNAVRDDWAGLRKSGGRNAAPAPDTSFVFEAGKEFDR